MPVCDLTEAKIFGEKFWRPGRTLAIPFLSGYADA
jgi:hypothetical protein